MYKKAKKRKIVQMYIYIQGQTPSGIGYSADIQRKKKEMETQRRGWVPGQRK